MLPPMCPEPCSDMTNRLTVHPTGSSLHYDVIGRRFVQRGRQRLDARSARSRRHARAHSRRRGSSRNPAARLLIIHKPPAGGRNVTCHIHCLRQLYVVVSQSSSQPIGTGAHGSEFVTRDENSLFANFGVYHDPSQTFGVMACPQTPQDRRHSRHSSRKFAGC